MVGMVIVVGIARAQDTLSQAKTACPKLAGTSNEFSDIDGDCECPENTECVMDGEFEAGCPFSGSNANNEGGFNTGVSFFSPSCSTCRCKAMTHRGCPISSMSLTPGLDGNCYCSTEGDTLCYMSTNSSWPGCDKHGKNNETKQLTSRFNDTRMFRSDCLGCVCQPPRYSVANRLTEEEQHCNADEPTCLVSGSLDVAHICPGTSDWEKCCDRDIHGCARACCGVLPAYLVVMIALGCLVAVLTPVLLCYCFAKAHPNKVSQDDGELELPGGRRVSMADLHNQISPGSKPARPKSAAARFAASAVAGLLPASIDRPNTARRREEGAAALPPVRSGGGTARRNPATAPTQPYNQAAMSGVRRSSGGPPPIEALSQRLSGGAQRPMPGGRPLSGARPSGGGGRPPPGRGPARFESVGGIMPGNPGVMPGNPGGFHGPPPPAGGAGGGPNPRPVSAAASVRSAASSSSRPGSAASNKRWSGLLEPGEGLQEAIPIEHAHFGNQYGSSKSSGGGVRAQVRMTEESASSSSESDDGGPPTLRPRSSSEMLTPKERGSWSGVLSPGTGMQNQ